MALARLGSIVSAASIRTRFVIVAAAMALGFA
jgi:hypothetical protein